MSTHSLMILHIRRIWEEMQFWHPILKAETKPKTAFLRSNENHPWVGAKNSIMKEDKKSEFLLTTQDGPLSFHLFSRCTLPGLYIHCLENLFWAHLSVYSGFDKRASFYFHLAWAQYNTCLLPIHVHQFSLTVTSSTAVFPKLQHFRKQITRRGVWSHYYSHYVSISCGIE